MGAMLLRAFVLAVAVALLGGCVAAVPFAGQAFDGIAKQAMSAMANQQTPDTPKDVVPAR
jgi:hypothetical protein